MKIQDSYPSGNVLWFNDFYYEDNKLIFSAGNFNGLYEYLIKENKLTFLGTFKNENIFVKQLYGKVHRYKDKLIFTPLSAENIAAYDLKDNEELAIHDDWYSECIGRWGERSYLLFNFDMVNIHNEVYLPSAQHNGLFKYSLDRNKYELIEIPCEYTSITTVTFDEECSWCSANNGKLLKLNENALC